MKACLQFVLEGLPPQRKYDLLVLNKESELERLKALRRATKKGYAGPAAGGEDGGEIFGAGGRLAVVIRQRSPRHCSARSTRAD